MLLPGMAYPATSEVLVTRSPLTLTNASSASLPAFGSGMSVAAIRLTFVMNVPMVPVSTEAVIVSVAT